MRKAIVCAILGLAGVGSLAGCGLVRNAQGDCCGDQRGRSQPAQVKSAGRSQPARTELASGKSHVRIEEPSLDPALPVDAAPIVSVERPAMPAASVKEIEPAPVAKTDPVSDEAAIIQRELAALQGKPAAPVVEEAPKGPAQTIIIEQSSATRKPADVKPIVIEPAPTIPELLSALPKEVVRQPVTPGAAVREALAAKEKTLTPKTVEIQAGKADSYKSITGHIEQYRKTWRLRY
ncbi:MAG: hypothetical protein HY289_00700, partial [Planctomycetes bacterium]|nr:hypothetical protein [Planctomycetota bacterium]